MVGDGLMAVFGAPLRSRDRCERAVRTPLETMENLSAFCAQQSTVHRVGVEIGIGIASGMMIAGHTGTQHRAT
jgi:class 3 adenylate cyclase